MWCNYFSAFNTNAIYIGPLGSSTDSIFFLSASQAYNDLIPWGFHYVLCNYAKNFLTFLKCKMKSWDYNTFLSKFISIFSLWFPYTIPWCKDPSDWFLFSCYLQEIALLGSKCPKQKAEESTFMANKEECTGVLLRSIQLETFSKDWYPCPWSSSSPHSLHTASIITVATRHSISFNCTVHISSRGMQIMNMKNSSFVYCLTYSHILHFSAPTVKK